MLLKQYTFNFQDPICYLIEGIHHLHIILTRSKMFRITISGDFFFEGETTTFVVTIVVVTQTGVNVAPTCHSNISLLHLILYLLFFSFPSLLLFHLLYLPNTPSRSFHIIIMAGNKANRTSRILQQRAQQFIQTQTGPKWKRELVQDHKWDYIDVDEFRRGSCYNGLR